MRQILPTVLLGLLLPAVAFGVCPPSCPAPGGGAPAHDCHAEFAGDGVRLNYKPFNPARPKPGKELRCFDGDAGCDRDGVANNACVFDIDVCLRNGALYVLEYVTVDDKRPSRLLEAIAK